MHFVTILEIQKKYHQKIDSLDLDLLIGHILKKERELILSHPEFKIPNNKLRQLEKNIIRRLKNEPLAYITREKEFYGLNFLVNRSTLIPRPETELLVNLALETIKNHLTRAKKINFIDIGTGSGNIIISVLKNIENGTQAQNLNFIAIDSSKKALVIAEKNAKNNFLDKRIKFIQGNLLNPLISIKKTTYSPILIITANLPYLSKEIYQNCPPQVKKYEPKTALYSPQDGLGHYLKLFKQLKSFNSTEIILFLEISPEQKEILTPIIKNDLPHAKFDFKKDLSNRWRIVKIEIQAH